MKYLLPLILTTTFAIAETPDRGVVSIDGITEESPSTKGLGFLVEKEGFVLTNYQNLVSGTDGRLHERFQVRSGDESFAAEVVGVEPTIGIGILKLATDRTFVPVVPARNRIVEPGAPLHAVSFENGSLHLIEGSISALNTKQCYQHSLAATMFRAKISIPESSTGGPVFYADSGEVAAIHTGFKPVPEPGHVEAEGETHLLPIDLCFNIYDSLKTKKSLKSPWTGFSVRPLEDSEQRFFPTAKKHHGGVVVEDVWENSPAQRMGVREGDILVQFSYNRILSVADFQKWLYMYGVDHQVKLIFLRNGIDYLTTDYLIEERPEWARPK